MESIIHHPYPVLIYFVAGFLAGVSFRYWALQKHKQEKGKKANKQRRQQSSR